MNTVVVLTAIKADVSILFRKIFFQHNNQNSSFLTIYNIYIYYTVNDGTSHHILNKIRTKEKKQ